MEKNFFQSSKFVNRLIVYLIIVVSFGLAIMMVIVFQSTKNIIHDEVVAHLLSVAQSRVDQIETFVLERKKDGIILANAPEVIEAFDKYIDRFNKGLESKEYITVDKAFRQYLTYYSEQFGYYDLFLISKQGDIVFTVAGEDDFGKNLRSDEYKGSELAIVFEKTKKNLGTSVSQFKYYQPSHEPAVFIATPTFYEGEFIGVIAFQIRAHELYQLSQDYTGLGETGEVVLASKQEGIVQFIAPLRHDADAAFQRTVSLESNLASPIINAVQGKNGFGTAMDYNGTEIIAVWRYIPILQWGMVAKMNSSEAYASLKELQFMMLIISGVTLFGIVLVAFLFSRTISTPILKLIQVTREIASGNLNIVAGIERNDEIGELSIAFDQMVCDLNNNLQKIDQQTRRIEKDNHFKTGQAGLGDVLRGEQAVDTLTQRVMEYLADFLKFQVGELYLLDSEALTRVADYASRSPSDHSVHYQIGEGLVGQVASEKRSILFSELPEEHFSLRINTGLGEFKPESVLGLPLLLDFQLIGVLVLGSPGEFTKDEIVFLEQASESIAIAVYSAQSRQQMRQLLEKSKQQ